MTKSTFHPLTIRNPFLSDVVVDNDDACSDGLTQISKDEIMNKSCTQEAKF